MLIKDYNSRITMSLVRNINFQITPQTSLSGKDANSLMVSDYSEIETVYPGICHHILG